MHTNGTNRPAMVYAMYEYNPLRTRHHPARECKLRFWSIQKHQHHCFRTHMDAVSLKPMDVFAHYALTPPHFDQLPVRVGWPNGVFEWASHMYLLVYYFRCGYRWMVFFPSVVIVIFHLFTIPPVFLSILGEFVLAAISPHRRSCSRSKIPRLLGQMRHCWGAPSRNLPRLIVFKSSA